MPHGFSLAAACGLLIVVASLAVEHRLEGSQAAGVAAPRLQSAGSIVMAHGLSCPEACGIFLEQELNPCLLHWQVDSFPLGHQGGPCNMFFFFFFSAE